MSEKNLNKVSQYTRKKIQNYSYGLNDQIGKGYSSQVYRGRNDQTDQPVAVKVIDLKMLKSQINRSLLASQIDILKSMKGMSYILALHDVYTTRNNTYIITELCQSDLNKKIKKKLSEQEILRYMKQLISGYAHVHKASIIHRDLKPANLLITTDNVLKIADFGFGIKAEQVLKPSKYNVGSPLYMAPESLRKNQYSFKTDIWALGIICFEMLTLQTPWKAKNEKQLLKKIQADKIEDIIQKKKYNFHPVMKDFIIKALNFDKNARLTPQQLFQFNFCDSQKINIINENKLHLTLKYQTFTSQVSTPHKSRENFHQKSEKKILNALGNVKNIQSQQHSLSQLPTIIRGQTTPGIQQRNQNTSPKHKKTSSFVNNNKLQSQNLNPQKVQNFTTNIKKEQKKSISKILIAEVHFCRFLFKLLMRIKQSLDEGILAPYKTSHQVKNIFISYTRIIKNKLKRILEFSSNNFLKIHKDTHQQYQETSDFKKLLKISKEYTDRYSKQLNEYWKLEQYQYSIWIMLDVSSTNTLMSLIKLLLEENIDLQADNQNNRSSYQYQTNDDALNQKIGYYSKDIIILDYLMTSRQLLDILKQNPEDHEKFSRKSRIQEIVEGATAVIDTPLYMKILDRAVILLEGDMLPVTNTNKSLGKCGCKQIDNRCR